LLLSFPAGVVADRVSRRGLMVAAEVLRAVALVALSALGAFGLLSVPLLALLGFVGAAGTVAFSVAAPALVPALLPRGSLARANGLLETARSAAFAAGPALGGFLVGWTGTSLAFAIAAILSIAAARLLARIPEPAREPGPRWSIISDLRDGAGFAWRDRYLRPILVTAVGWNLAWIVLQAAYVPYAATVLRLTASGIGTSLASFGVGMLIGATIAPGVIRRFTLGATIVIGPLVSVIAAGVMVATVWCPSAILASVAFFLFGAGPLIWTVSTVTLRQTITPASLLGRVSALYMTANTGIRPLGALCASLIGATYGPTACVIIAAAGFLVQLLTILLSPVPQLAGLPTAAHRDDDRQSGLGESDQLFPMIGAARTAR
jgi:MFS family permease